MKKSYQTGSYLNYPIREVFSRLSGLGYDGIEISAATGCGAFYPSVVTDQEVQTVCGLAKSFDLPVVSYDCELITPSGWNMASDSPSVRQRTVDYVHSAISLAQRMEARFVVVVAGRATYGVRKKDAWKWAVEGFQECASHARSKDIFLGLEHLTPLEGNVVVTLDDVLQMLEDVDSPHLLALLDTGHVGVVGESLVDYVFQLGEKLGHIHVDDNDGTSDDHLPPGCGTINFDPFFCALKKSSYQGYLSIEPSLSFCTDPDSAASIGISFLNRYLGA